MWLGVGAEKLGGVEMPVGHLSGGVTNSFLEAGGREQVQQGGCPLRPGGRFRSRPLP